MKLKIDSRMRKYLVTIISLIGISILSVVFQGCEQESILENLTGYEYLELETYDLSEMSKTDFQKLGFAIQRLKINNNHGICHIEQTSGVQVNISESLYDHIKSLFDNTNKILRSNTLNLSSPRLKAGQIENPPQYDCVPYALSEMGGVSYTAANAWCVTAFGPGGVPSSGMDSAVHNFYPNSTNSVSTMTGGDMNNALIYFSASDSTGHAVNGVNYDSNTGYILYRDYQNNSYGVIHRDSVLGVYYP